jgi:hypothetical protein
MMRFGGQRSDAMHYSAAVLSHALMEWERDATMTVRKEKREREKKR